MENPENVFEGTPQDTTQDVNLGVSKSLSDLFDDGKANQPVEFEAPVETVVAEEPASEPDVVVDNAPEVNEVEKEDIVEIGDVPVAEEVPTLETVDEVQQSPEPVAQQAQAPDLPEGVGELVDFINGGGTMQEYLSLNKDYSDYSDDDLLKEYYKNTKENLDAEDIDFLLEDNFKFDSELDDERDIRKKKIALKEELRKAKAYLEDRKSKYAEIKKSPSAGVTQEQLESQKRAQEASEYFTAESDKFFDGFKGFDFSLGENKQTIRYRVDNADNLKQYNMDFNNLLGEFVGDDGRISNTAGYHKALFMAKNGDKIAQLFYEQGKADAIKESSKEAKNINFDQQKHEPSSNTKLKPGQAREIENPNADNRPRVKLSEEFWKKR